MSISRIKKTCGAVVVAVGISLASAGPAEARPMWMENAAESIQGFAEQSYSFVGSLWSRLVEILAYAGANIADDG